MSLLTTRAPHLVTIIHRETAKNEDGINVTAETGERTDVRCMVEPVRDWSSAEEQFFIGKQVVDMRIIRSKKWSGGLEDHVIWEGDRYELTGAPQHHSVGRKTSHWRVTIRWISREV